MKFGRLPPKDAPALRLAPLLTGVISAPDSPTGVDYGTRFTGWQVLGNNTYGDCVAVAWANQRALVTTILTGTTDYPGMDEVLELYKTQNPNFPADDAGMEVQTALEYLATTGGPDGVKAVAFAKVDHTNQAELHAAHAIFGQVLYGVTVLYSNITEFDSGQPWDYDPSSSVDGGHCVDGVGYTPDTYRFVTWATETGWTEAFAEHQVEEAWVIVWPEHLGTTAFETGVDVAALADAYLAITGRVLPVPLPDPPVPTPEPDPVPIPIPVPVPIVPVVPAADVKLAATLPAGWVTATHVGANRKAAVAVDRWLRETGL